MASHESAVPGRPVLFALLFALVGASVVTGAFLLGRIAGGEKISPAHAVGNLLVATGERLRGSDSDGDAAGRPAPPQSAAVAAPAGEEPASPAAPSASPPEEEPPPITVADKQSPSPDSSPADDHATARTADAQSSDTGDRAAADLPPDPVVAPPPPPPLVLAARSAPAQPVAAVAATQATPAAAPRATAAKPVKVARAAAAPPPSHLMVPAPAPEKAGAAPSPTVYAVELGFFLSGKLAEDFAAELRKRDIAVSLVTETDADGRSLTSVHSGRFLDSAEAFAYAYKLALTDHLPGQVVIEKAAPQR